MSFSTTASCYLSGSNAHVLFTAHKIPRQLGALRCLTRLFYETTSPNQRIHLHANYNLLQNQWAQI